MKDCETDLNYDNLDDQIKVVSKDDIFNRTLSLNCRIDGSLSKISILKEKLNKHLIEKEKNKDLKILKDKLEIISKEKDKLLNDLESKENKCRELVDEYNLNKEMILEQKNKLLKYEEQENLRIEKELINSNILKTKRIVFENINSLEEYFKNY